MYSFEIPWPPSANRYWRYNRGRAHVSDEAKAYKKLICQLNLIWKIPCLKNRLSVHIKAYPPDKRRRDIDNLNKIVLDALQKAGLFLDDSQIDRLIIEREPIFEKGKLEVKIFELG